MFGAIQNNKNFKAYMCSKNNHISLINNQLEVKHLNINISIDIDQIAFNHSLDKYAVIDKNNHIHIQEIND